MDTDILYYSSTIMDQNLNYQWFPHLDIFVIHFRPRAHQIFEISYTFTEILFKISAILKSEIHILVCLPGTRAEVY